MCLYKMKTRIYAAPAVKGLTFLLNKLAVRRLKHCSTRYINMGNHISKTSSQKLILPVSSAPNWPPLMYDHIIDDNQSLVSCWATVSSGKARSHSWASRPGGIPCKRRVKWSTLSAEPYQRALFDREVIKEIYMTPIIIYIKVWPWRCSRSRAI